MQSSLNQIAEVLAERVGRQFDIPFREELKVIIEVWRIKLVVDSLNSRPKDRKFFTVWIEDELIEVNTSEFPGFPDCPILRTKHKIPDPIRANSILFDYVGKLDRMDAFTLREPHEIKALMGSKYTGGRPKACRVNGYIYIIGDLNLPGIAINLIPEDLNAVKEMTAETALCYNDDEPYPVPGDIKQRIIQAILSTELRNMLPGADEEIKVVNDAIKTQN